MWLVPALRFPEFSGEWDEYAIGEILSIGNGRDYKHLHNGDIPVFGTGGYMTSVDDFLYDGESVFVGRKGTINKPLYYNGKFWTVDTLFYTYNFTDVLPKFVYCLFQTINWLKYNEASGVPSLSKATIEKIKVRIPSMDEQDKLSNLLFLCYKRIEVQNKIIEKLETLIKGIVEKTFVSSQYVTLQHYSPIITSGKDQNSGGNYPLYGSTGVIGSVLNPSYNKPIVLIARVGSIGNVQYVTAPCGISDNTLIIDAGEDNRFIYYYLNGYNFSHIISGTTQPLITASSVKKIEIPVIEKHRRKKIVSTLYAIEQKLRNEKYIAYLLSRQKYFLLSQMFI